MNSLYGTPVAGMQGASFALDTVANNIANLNTSGFEEVTPILESLPLQNQLTDPTNAVGTSAANRLGMGVRAGATQRSQEQAPLVATGNPQDLALTGTKYFTLTQPNGQLSYAQQISLHIQPDGTLVSAQGLPLSPSVRVPPTVTKVGVDSQGALSGQAVNGQTVQLGSLHVVTFPAPENLQADGQGLYTETLGSGRPQQPATGSAPVFSGYQLGSTVDLSTQMTSIIEDQQQFSANTKALQTLDSLVNTVVNLQTR